MLMSMVMAFFISLLPGMASFASTQQKAMDTERRTDINALHGQVEAYYAQFATYPTLAQFNDASWRSDNMRGLDAEALADPEGSSEQLVASPQAHAYSYQPAPQGCDNQSQTCDTYTLTATYHDGTTYQKTALN